MKRLVTVSGYGGWKDFFPPSLDVEVDGDAPDLEELSRTLVRLRPESAALLGICRFAVDDEMVEPDYLLADGTHVHVFPPFGGG